ncbi:uncharacterized protein isoform X1 [Leptinotarsa decemlineata]|uniref:uncharacterized protein isoform X1 n=2 Tax=Leptinotarsa decemlineata TaxID=7539 RepID=UPI003D307D6E
MSYYKPSYSQSVAMVRGRGYSSRSSYRGGSGRGNSSWGGNRGRGDGGYSGSRYSSHFSGMESRSPYDSKPKYSSSADRFSRSDDYHKSYRSDSSYLGRESRRSPERKRMRLDATSSRHESSYGGYGASGRHDPPSYSERRYSGERHTSTPFSTRRDEFRRPSGPPRGTYRGRLSTRGTRGLRGRDRPIRRRLVDSSYTIRKRIVPRTSDYSRRLKISRMRSAIVARRAIRRRDSEKESDDDAEKKEKNEDEEVEKEDGDKDGEKSPTKDKDAADKDDKSESGDEKKKKRTFIKLHCPQCSVKAITFRKYEIHLQSKTHLFAMRKVALKQKGILAQMRQAQRNTQNELEKSSDELSTKTNFCPLCKLNYKQKKAVHQLSEAHKNMKKFLMPYCKVCNITFKSPMIFENHLCSIDHMKRKQRMENSSDVSAEEDNLENFTTIDSVGDVDGEGGSENEEKKEDVKEPVNVGIEKIRKIEAYYCDLCKMYLQRGEESEMSTILSKHCKIRVHMQRYVRMKERQDLEKRAEKLQRKETAEREDKDKKDDKENESIEDAETKDKKGSDCSAKMNDDEEMKDDKLWADVDKDLGDILAEAESGNKSSDEDDDSHINGERYDRFKLSEKNGDEKLMGADEESILDDKLVIKETEEK